MNKVMMISMRGKLVHTLHIGNFLGGGPDQQGALIHQLRTTIQFRNQLWTHRLIVASNAYFL